MDGIWIRSQNKGLYRCIGFDAPQVKSHASDKNRPFAIVGYVSDEMQPILGWYATKERALQVLDEIQTFIREHEYCGVTGGNNSFNNTFEMPAK